MLLTDITIHPFVGHTIRPYLPCVAKLSIEVYKEYPFLYESSLEDEMQALQKFADHEEAISIVVFDGSTIVGASMGIPLEAESEDILSPFKQKKIDSTRYYHFAESFLLKAYRGRGIGHHFFDLREEFACRLERFDFACFYNVDRPDNDPKRPEDHLCIEDLWRKRGFSHHKEIRFRQKWKDVGEEISSEKELSFWIKDLRNLH